MNCLNCGKAIEVVPPYGELVHSKNGFMLCNLGDNHDGRTATPKDEDL